MKEHSADSCIFLRMYLYAGNAAAILVQILVHMTLARIFAAIVMQQYILRVCAGMFCGTIRALHSLLGKPSRAMIFIQRTKKAGWIVRKDCFKGTSIFNDEKNSQLFILFIESI